MRKSFAIGRSARYQDSTARLSTGNSRPFFGILRDGTSHRAASIDRICSARLACRSLRMTAGVRAMSPHGTNHDKFCQRRRVYRPLCCIGSCLLGASTPFRDVVSLFERALAPRDSTLQLHLDSDCLCESDLSFCRGIEANRHLLVHHHSLHRLPWPFHKRASNSGRDRLRVHGTSNHRPLHVLGPGAH